MGPDYKLAIQGAQPSHTAEQVAEALAPVLRRTPQELLPALSARQAITVNLKGLPLIGARAFKEKIDNTGCAATLDSTAPPPPEAALLPGNFDGLTLRPLFSRTVGLVFNVPSPWHDVSEDTLFRVKHTGTRTWFTSSMNRISGFGLAVWAEIRFGAVAEKQGHLAPYCPPYSLQTAAGPAIVAEFRGLVPGDSEPTHMLVICLRPSFGQISLNIAATVSEFEAHRALYQWLLRTQLRLFAGGAADEVAAKAAKEHPEAQYDQAVKFAKAGRMKEAAELFQKVAATGHAEAQRDLGFCYINGDGVVRDQVKAFQLWSQAAEQGLPSAQLNLAMLYEQGVGTPADIYKSFHWLHKAAEAGDRDAQFNLAISYQNGKGVEKSVESKGKWLLKAAELGHRDAQFYAATMHESGTGLPLDPQQAIAWYRKAAAQGHEAAANRLKALVH